MTWWLYHTCSRIELRVRIVAVEREPRTSGEKPNSFLTEARLCKAGNTDHSEGRLVAIFFSLDFFQQLFFRLTLDTELRKGDGIQSPLTDLYAALCTDPIGAFGEPRQRFVYGLPAAIAHFH